MSRSVCDYLCRASLPLHPSRRRRPRSQRPWRLCGRPPSPPPITFFEELAQPCRATGRLPHSAPTSWRRFRAFLLRPLHATVASSPENANPWSRDPPPPRRPHSPKTPTPLRLFYDTVCMCRDPVAPGWRNLAPRACTALPPHATSGVARCLASPSATMVPILYPGTFPNALNNETHAICSSLLPLGQPIASMVSLSQEWRSIDDRKK